MENPSPLTDAPRATRIKKGTACLACRSKKRRCNGAKPVCALCEYDSEPECVYAAMKVRPRTLILQEKIDKLEMQVGLAQSTLDTAGHINGGLKSNIKFPTSPAHSTGPMVSSRNSLSPLKSRSLQLLPACVDPLIGSWWTTDDPPPSGLITVLIKLFVEQEHQQSHDPRPPEFYESLYSPNLETGLHPALRNAIFLIACHHNFDPVLSRLEPVFLRRVMYYLHQSLGQADRLLDYIEAYTLLAISFLYKGSYLRGTRNAAGAIIFAGACGLHALRPPSWQPHDTASLLPPPASRTEIQRRVRVWWMIFTLNRLGGSAHSVDYDMGDEIIETVWDLPPETSSFEETPHSTVSSLFTRGSRDTWVYHDTANVIRSKCIALMGRATRLGSKAITASENDRVFWVEFETMRQAVRRVTESLPPFLEEPHSAVDTACVETQPKIASRYIVTYHILMCEAAIMLHSRLARAGHVTAQKVCLEASWRMMPVVRHMLKQGIDASAFTYCGVAWARVFRELAIEHDRLLAIGNLELAESMIPELKTLLRAIREQLRYIPLYRLIIVGLKSEFPSLHEREPDMFSI
ncbi:hypothetical protein BOTBODRAFT_26277 [Botryobasidium botryosum FD-172 SS1]|uniref:Zn(2)-C6 fungal-type domain-containing protein n=1 Tax=Botryobasidium botryosum (strain FD-172 SS1) TaxID=930990 RepID=A0A067N4J8_BOTB1|nr:hypothetical protein BOTBODRAFT_26277 [Botryobasidium botryosum FD-172 SS1]